MAQRPVRQIEAAHCAGAFGQPHLLPFAQPVDAGRDDDVALGQTVADDDAVRLIARDHTGLSVTAPGGGSTTQTAGLPALSNSALAGSTTTGAVDGLEPADDAGAEAHLLGRRLRVSP